MLRMFLVQAWLNLSDEGCEDVCYDNLYSVEIADIFGNTYEPVSALIPFQGRQRTAQVL